MLAIDQNIKAVQHGGTGTVTTASFSTTTGNQLLLAFVVVDQTATANTPTGAGLTWVRVLQANGNPFQSAEIFRAYSPAILSGQTVTATSTNAASDIFLNIVSITGADPTGSNGSGAIGATSTAASTNAAVSTSVITTRSNSWVFGVGCDTQTAAAPTAGTGQVILQSDTDATDVDSSWSQRRIGLTGTIGTTVTINVTSPSADSCNIGAVEVLPIQGEFQLPNTHLRPHAFSPGIAR